MGASWGSKWFAVLDPDPGKCRVEMVDCGPNPLATNDQPWVPVPEHLANCQQYPVESSAVQAVRCHILKKTHSEVVERVAAMEIIKLDMQRLRMTEPKSSSRDAKLKACAEDLALLKEEVGQLRALRRRKIPVS